MQIGDLVVKNPETFMETNLAQWGAGEGTGIIIQPPDNIILEPGRVQVQWGGWVCLQFESELILQSDLEPTPSRVMVFEPE